MNMETSVEVAVDPATAFRAFTEEMESWWGNGPIDAWDYSRAVSRRIEPGIGGRVLELYSNGTLELARITTWEPGERLSWKSSVDDVAIDVSFEPVPEGTLVSVTGTVPDGGSGAAGLAILRVTPDWFPRYFARGRRPWEPVDRLMVIVRYARPAAMARWLCDAFGFEPTRTIPGDDDALRWAELRLGRSVLVVQGSDATDGAGITHEVFLFVDDLDAHFARAERAGADIVQPIKTYGYTAYVADDPEGRRWNFVRAKVGA
jgi:uncharacterized glyoxalase superfamily protein PhnB